MDSFDGKHPDPPRKPATALDITMKVFLVIACVIFALIIWIKLGSMLADYYELGGVTRLVTIMFLPIPIGVFVGLAIELWRYQQRD